MCVLLPRRLHDERAKPRYTQQTVCTGNERSNNLTVFTGGNITSSPRHNLACQHLRHSKRVTEGRVPLIVFELKITLTMLSEHTY